MSDDTDGVARNARQAVELLAQHGADLSRPRPVEHFFNLRDEEAARALAAELEGEYDVQVLPPDEDEDDDSDLPVAVIAEHEMVVSADALLELRERFEPLAEQHGGEYDGWESRVEKEDEP